MKFLEKYFSKKVTFKLTAMFHMKSGSVVYVRCDSLKITKNGNELVSYEITGVSAEDSLYIRLDDVSAIQYIRNK